MLQSQPSLPTGRFSLSRVKDVELIELFGFTGYYLWTRDCASITPIHCEF